MVIFFKKTVKSEILRDKLKIGKLPKRNKIQQQ